MHTKCSAFRLSSKRNMAFIQHAMLVTETIHGVISIASPLTQTYRHIKSVSRTKRSSKRISKLTNSAQFQNITLYAKTRDSNKAAIITKTAKITTLLYIYETKISSFSTSVSSLSPSSSSPASVFIMRSSNMIVTTMEIK